VKREKPRYRLELKNEKLRFYRSFAVFLFVLNFVAIGLMLTPTGSRATSTLLIEIISSIIFLGYGSYLIIRGRAGLLFEGLMIIFCIGWIWMGHWWPAAVNVVLVILYRSSVRVPVVELNSRFLRYPSFPLKEIPWNEIENVILKDGLLTIDLRNNRLIQQMLAAPGDNSPNETEINEFCRARIGAATDAAN